MDSYLNDINAYALHLKRKVETLEDENKRLREQNAQLKEVLARAAKAMDEQNTRLEQVRNHFILQRMDAE